MQCPKCKRETPATGQFCIRCHAPLRYVCPTCKHTQDHGGKCDSCGMDFEKYLAVLNMQMEAEAQKERKRSKDRSALVRQVFLLPLTGGLSLLKYFQERLQNK